ncbi:MAG TPA: type II secretion system protein GspJ, partial [Tepidisphaeraceae bacterium]|nr:type II secretion system protein GspJ [Tepidisphaeraceae bacterium]
GTMSQLSDTVEFYAVKSGVDSNDPTKEDGLRRIDLELTTLDDGTQALVENITPTLPGDQQLIGAQQSTQAQSTPEILCRGVASFSAEYYDGQDWNNTWDATAYNDALPMAVQITIQLKSPTNSTDRPGMTLTRVFALPTAVPVNTAGGT